MYIRCDRVKASLSPAYTGPWLVRKVDDKSIFVQNGLKIDKISIDRCKIAKLLNVENMEFNDSQQDLFFSGNDDDYIEESRPPPVIPVRNGSTADIDEGDLARVFCDYDGQNCVDVPEIAGTFALGIHEQLPEGPNERYTRYGRNVRLPSYLNDYEVEL